MDRTETAADLPEGAIVDNNTGDVWTPPATNEEGHALEGEYPHNRRLRAEALAKAGKTTDPDGIVTDELIAETADRLEREDRAAEEEAAASTPTMDMTRDEIDAIGARMDPPIDTTKAKDKAEAISMITGATTGSGGDLTQIERLD